MPLPARAALAAVLLAGCVPPTAQQQELALTPLGPATERRALDSRRFDTADQRQMLAAAVGVLQDLGFAIEESQAALGIVVGSRLAGGRVRAQIAILPAATPGTSIVRATFQRMIPRPGAMLPVGETIRDPELYRGFFDKLAQSLFLTAHEI